MFMGVCICPQWHAVCVHSRGPFSPLSIHNAADIFRACEGFIQLRSVPNRTASFSTATPSWLCFVEFEGPRDAYRAIAALHNYSFDLKKRDEARL